MAKIAVREPPVVTPGGKAIQASTVTLPDGTSMRDSDAVAAGYTIRPHGATASTTAPGLTFTAEEIDDMVADGMAPERVTALDRKYAIARLPEAAERPHAAAALAADPTVTLDAAARALRGLPTETAEAQAEAQAQRERSNPVDPKVARLAEIRALRRRH